jgi:hypothetical protein
MSAAKSRYWPPQSIRRKFPQRIPALALISIGAVSVAAPASAQTYPVCLHVYGEVTYYECRYTSPSSATHPHRGRAGQCEINPYVATAPINQPPIHHRRHHHRA